MKNSPVMSAATLAKEEKIEAVQKLTKDIKIAVSTMGVDEARFLVDTYYQLQHERITCAGRIRSQSEDGEPHMLMAWLFRQFDTLENQIKLALDKFSDNYPVGVWAKSQHGIGPVIAAGLIAHIKPEHCSHAAKVWRFAGLAPKYEWGKGELRPYNLKLKTLCAYKMGESFVKTNASDKSYYGKVYKKRKELEIERNGKGEFAALAAEILEKKKIGKTTEAYKALIIGQLPPAHLHARARRVAVKLFLSHFAQVYWETTFNEPSAPIYAIKYLEHDDYQAPPGYTPLKAKK